MMELLNTLYVMTEGAFVHLDHDTVRMEVQKETKARFPLLSIGQIVCFGNILVSPSLMQRCIEEGRSIAFLTMNGHFQARVEGRANGNVLLRHAQHLAREREESVLAIARGCVAGKIQNSRLNLLRGARETSNDAEQMRLTATAKELGNRVDRLQSISTLDGIRGIEGDAAQQYFHVFDDMLKEDQSSFSFVSRTRRPPLNRMNAMLSFAYTLLMTDAVAALVSVGLDEQVGFLHTLRPGKPALALDLMEELRPVLADRLVLTLVNRKQIQADDFQYFDGGAVYLNERGKKELIAAYQRRKQAEVYHRVLDRKIPLGLILHIQAKLLARYLRGDMESYLPYLHR